MSLNAHLKSLLQDLSAELPEVTERFMFGSDAFFANSNIYALVWDGRVVLRFPNEAKFVTARDLEDAAIFDPMGTGKTMGKWVCMPESMADDVEALRPWVEEAHREAMMEPPKKPKKQRKRSLTPTPTASRAPARRTGKAPASRASRAGSRRGSR